MSRRLRWLALVAVLGLSVPLASTRSVSAQTPATCPAGATLTLVAPTAAAPTTVSVTVAPALNIKPATAADAASFHLHYFIDTPATAAGTVIPTGDPKVLHSGNTTQDLGVLAVGSHTVTVVLGQLNHTACDTRASVTFTTVATAAPVAVPVAAPAKTGNAGLAGVGGTPMFVVGSLVGVMFLMTIGARKISGRRQ